jgi:glycosyltransferase involved in cell wall biosynthesis
MNILVINKFLYPRGGAEVVALDTGKLLAKKGHTVNYWGMKHPNNPGYPLENLFVSEVDYHTSMTWRQKMTAATNILYSFEAQKCLESLLKTEKFHIAHLHNIAHQLSPSILTALAKFKIPTIMTLHDYKLVCPAYTMTLNGRPCYRCKDGRYYQCTLNKCTKNSLLKSTINTLEMYLHHRLLHIYNKIDVLISPSRFLKERCLEMGLNQEIIHLPNFVEISGYSPRYDWTEKSIVFLGRVSQEKGIKTLIEAVKGLNISLKIIGDGPLLAELKDKVQNEHIDNVSFLGYRSGDDLKNEIKNSMVCVLPSECYENNPRSVIEAFALGKPVIGARIGGIPELVRDGETGWTFESGNAADLRAKIETVLSTPAEIIIKMGKTARNEVENHFHADKHYEKLMEIYTQTIRQVRK